MSPRPRLYTGPDAARAADKIRQLHENQEQWPYPHCYPPVASIPVERIASVVTPNAAASATVLTYKVPEGNRFYLRSVLAQVTGGNFSAGQVLWTLTLNTDPTVASIQAQRVQGFTNIPVNLGNWQAGVKWHLERAYEFEPLDVLRWIGFNVSYGAGDPNYLTGGLFGYLVPTLKG